MRDSWKVLVGFLNSAIADPHDAGHGWRLFDQISIRTAANNLQDIDSRRPQVPRFPELQSVARLRSKRSRALVREVACAMFAKRSVQRTKKYRSENDARVRITGFQQPLSEPTQ